MAAQRSGPALDFDRTCLEGNFADGQRSSFRSILTSS